MVLLRRATFGERMLVLKLVALVVVLGCCLIYGAAGLAQPVVRALSGSAYRTCALMEAGVNASRVKCWGGGVGGQVKELGDNLRWATLPASFSPVGLVAVSGAGYAWDAAGRLVDLSSGNDTGLDSRVTQVCQGASPGRSPGSFTCALQASGRVRCWGENDVGQLGRGDRMDRVAGPEQSVEVDLSLGGKQLNASSVWCGIGRACALVEQGNGTSVSTSLKCWGWLGSRNATATALLSTGEPLGVAKVVLVGNPLAGNLSHFAVVLLRNGSVWSLPDPGQGDGGLSSIKTGVKDVCALGSEGFDDRPRFCYVLLGGQLECAPSSLVRSAQAAVDLGAGQLATAAHCGAEFACVALASGGVKCAGGNANAELGSGDREDRREPFQLGDRWPEVNLRGPPLPAVRSVHVASGRSCAVVGLAASTAVRCWGDGVPLSQSSELDLGMDVTALALGDRHACAVSSNRVSVKCWGSNGERQASSAPVPLLKPAPDLPSVLANEPDPTAVLDIAVASTFSCVFRASGLVTCWGGASTTSDAVRTWKVGLPGASSSAWERGLAFAARKDGALCKPARIDTVFVQVNGNVTTSTTTSSVEMCCWTGPGPSMADIVVASDGTLPLGTTQIANRGLVLVGDVVFKLEVQRDSVTGLTRVPFRGDGRWSSIAAEATSAVQCGVRAPKGDLHCWGLGSDGRLGLESNASLSEPVERPVDFGSDRGVYGLAVGPTHSCARLDNGEVKCWGANERYQLGLSDNIARGGGPGTMGDRLAAARLLPGPYVQSTSRPTSPTAAPTTAPTAVNFIPQQPSGSLGNVFVAVAAILGVAVASVAIVQVAAKIKARRAARAGADSTQVASTALL